MIHSILAAFSQRWQPACWFWRFDPDNPFIKQSYEGAPIDHCDFPSTADSWR